MCWAKVVRKDPAGAGMRTKCVASCPGLPTPPPAPTLHPTPTPPMDAALRGEAALGRSGPLLLPWGVGRATGRRERGDGGGERMIIASGERRCLDSWILSAVILGPSYSFIKLP